jgi:hypothetical protein
MDLDLLWPWRGAALAFLVALGWAGLWRLLRRPWLGALGAGLGFTAAVVLTLGFVTATPRQLPERLPMLLAVGTGAALLLSVLAGGGWRRTLATLGSIAVLLAGAWWLAGAPVVRPDLSRGAVPLIGLAVLLAALQLGLRGPWQAAMAAAFLLLGLFLAAPIGPWSILAAIALAAAAGAALAGPDWDGAARLPMALGIGGLIAGPVLARGAAFDWTAGAAPLSALLLAPVLAPMMPGAVARPLAWLIAGGVPLMFTWLLISGP